MPFTATTADDSIQDMKLWKELRIAASRRHSAAYGFFSEFFPENWLALFTVGSLVREFQKGIWGMSLFFADPRARVGGVDKPLENGGHEDWSALSHGGLPRRLPGNATHIPPLDDYNAEGWEYGLATDDDIMGIWLVQDMQARLKELTRISSHGDWQFCEEMVRDNFSGDRSDDSPLMNFALNHIGSFVNPDPLKNYHASAFRRASAGQSDTIFIKIANLHTAKSTEKWTTKNLSKYRKRAFLFVLANRLITEGGDIFSFYPLLKPQGVPPIPEGETTMIGFHDYTTSEVLEFVPPRVGDYDFAGAYSAAQDDFHHDVDYDFFIAVDYEFNDGDTEHETWEAT